MNHRTVCLHFLRLTLCWLASAGALLFAWHIRDPHLLPIRALAPWLLLATCLLSAWGFAFSRQRVLRRLGFLILALALLIGIHAEISFRLRRQAVLSTGSPAMQQIGQHFIAGFHDWESAGALASRGLVGGLYITRRNLEGLAMDDLRERIARLQAMRAQAGLPPLLVVADQEGGAVSHLSPLLPHRAGLNAIADGATTDEELDALAFAAGQAHGRDLHNVGVNMNLAPVVDLRHEDAHDFPDWHSRIASRAIAADAATVSRVAAAYVRGLQDEGVQGCLKHFPGLGSARGDTHHVSASLAKPVAELEAQDWRPFAEITQTVHVPVMIGHVYLPQLDAQRPASFSAPVIQGVIRGKLQYGGVLITDDLGMAAAWSHGLCNVVPAALNAGADLLLVSYDGDKIYDALHCALRSWQRGEISAGALRASKARLTAMREHFSP